jgi:transcriptional regulator with XRE-family HTH domain
MDDSRVGRSLRVLRLRKRLTQEQLGTRADVSQSAVSLAERGHIDRLSLRTLRRLFGAVDAGLDCRVVWRGGAVDRLLDARHAAVVEATVAALRGLGWEVEVEVSFAFGREVGSIDVVAVRRDLAAAAMFEIKSDITSIEELGRRTDIKERLLPRIAEERFGFRPGAIARILVAGESSGIRARVVRHAATFDRLFPGRNVHVRRWLRDPQGRFAGIWFLRVNSPGGKQRRSGSFGGARRA